MPLSRYQIRNEFSLADPELYREAEKDDPEALLEGVAMAALVGVLRQLGDLAEFAAEIFHNLHEEVMATAARGHSLKVRVQQLEAEFPSFEKTFLCQTNHSSFFHNAGVDWHPNLHMDQNLMTQEDLPRFIMDSYEECRGPPRLFLLDKFDVAGAGACLKRYTDPSFFKVQASAFEMMKAEVQREKKTRKAKKKGSHRRNGATPEVLPTSHAKLRQLFLEERVENGIGDPARHVKLKRRLNGFPFDSKFGKSYMEKLFKTPSPKHKEIHEISANSSAWKLPPIITSSSGLEVLEISTVSPKRESLQREGSPCSSSNIEGTVLKPWLRQLSVDVTDGVMLTVPEQSSHLEADNILPTLQKFVNEKEIVVDGESKVDGSVHGHQSDDTGREIDNYMDALTTMESEMEIDSEFRAKNGLGLLQNEKQVTDTDANEDQLEVHVSDSQSTRNSTALEDWNTSSRKGISSSSYSDTVSTLAENTPLDKDVAAKVFPSTENFQHEIIGKSSGQLSVNEQVPVPQPPELLVSNGPSVEVGEVPCDRPDFGEMSSSIHCTDLGPKLSPVDPGELLMKGTLVVSELDEIFAECSKPDTKFSEETGNNLSVNLSRTPRSSDVSSQTKDILSPITSVESGPVDELDDEDSIVFPDVSIHFSTILELEATLDKNSNESPLDDMHQTAQAESNYAKILVGDQIKLPHSIISHPEGKPFDVASPEFETCNPNVKPNGTASEVHTVPSDGEVAVASEADPLTSDEEVALNLNPVVESPNTPNFAEQQVLEITGDVPPLNLDSKEVDVSYSEEKTHNGALSTADGEEMSEISPKMDLIGSDAGTFEFPSDISNSPDRASLTEVHSHSEEKKPVTAEAELVLMIPVIASPGNDANNNDADSPSINLKMLHEEPLFSPEDLDRSGLEIFEECLAENYEESNKERESDQQTIASPDLNSILCSTVCCDHFQSELVGSVPDYSLAAETENSLHLDNAPLIPSSSEHSSSDSESKSPQQNEFVENVEDACSSILIQQAVASPVPDSTLYNAVPCDDSDTQCLNSVPDPSLAAEAKNCLHLDNSNKVPSSSEHSGQVSESKSLQQNSLVEITDDLSLPVRDFGEFKIPLYQHIELNADQHGVVSVTKGSLALFSQSKLIQPPNDLDQERHFDAYPEFGPVDLPSHHSMVRGSPQYGRHKLGIPLQAMDSSISIFPDFGLPEATQINLEEMPPMPPLPPVQWRIGKLQHISPASERNAAQYSVDYLPPILSSTAEEKTQLGFLAMQGDIIQPSNPVLPLSAVKDETSQHGHGHLAASLVHSGQFPLQMPTMVNHGNSLDDFLTSGETQSVDPFLTRPVTYAETAQQCFHAEEGQIMQPSVNSVTTLTKTGNAASAYVSGSLHEKPFQHLRQAPETNLEDEKLKQSSGISEGEVRNPCNILESLQSEEYGQLQHVFLTSEGEIAWSAFEDAKPNGNRPMKIPRPRSPLIDAVAAHDKSKLRKAIERVRPQIQKIDERDSLLEQIRAKSFNLKPAVVTRPSIEGPKTNLKVAAILEKANAIRQALAGSDEDDDVDSWSDS
ncbi:unnamed protein product [Ilex paraguariensis]|uniref:Protein SCAR n=1 Tax=Ilex paraguariensis TaxID=185542 RepID=A0ABC8RZQ3_9AQUA